MLIHVVFRKSIIIQARNKAINCPLPNRQWPLFGVLFFLLSDIVVTKFSSFCMSRSITLIFKTLLPKLLGQVQYFEIDTDEMIKSKLFPQLNFTMWKYFPTCKTVTQMNLTATGVRSQYPALLTLRPYVCMPEYI